MPNYIKITLFLVLILSKVIVVYGQTASLVITGNVLDDASGQSIPYATVAAVSNTSEMVINGATTDDYGNFELIVDEANMYIEISFIGYEKKSIRDFRIFDNKVSLGSIRFIARRSGRTYFPWKSSGV